MAGLLDNLNERVPTWWEYSQPSHNIEDRRGDLSLPFGFSSDYAAFGPMVPTPNGFGRALNTDLPIQQTLAAALLSLQKAGMLQKFEENPLATMLGVNNVGLDRMMSLGNNAGTKSD
jgi:hypothetical protein